jgi:hypothetical protein
MDAILAAFFGIQSNAQNDYDDPAFKAARESFQVGTFQRIMLSVALLFPGGSLIMKYFPSVVMGQFSSLLGLTNKIIEAKKNGVTEGDNVGTKVNLLLLILQILLILLQGIFFFSSYALFVLQLCSSRLKMY